MPKPYGNVYYDMRLTDVKTGKTIRKFRKRLCHSFVKQFLQLLEGSMSLRQDVSVLDTGNTTRTMIYFSGDPFYHADAGAGNVNYGSIVGTSLTAVTINDYKIGTIIGHGTSSGQLQYSAESFGAPTSDATTAYFILTRVFTNGSGGSITVNEIALYVAVKDIAGNAYYFCILHDILAAPVAVGNGQALTLNYTIKVSL